MLDVFGRASRIALQLVRSRKIGIDITISNQFSKQFSFQNFQALKVSSAPRCDIGVKLQHRSWNVQGLEGLYGTQCSRIRTPEVQEAGCSQSRRR